jgi:hypothetical protein
MRWLTIVVFAILPFAIYSKIDHLWTLPDSISATGLNQFLSDKDGSVLWILNEHHGIYQLDIKTGELTILSTEPVMVLDYNKEVKAIVSNTDWPRKFFEIDLNTGERSEFELSGYDSYNYYDDNIIGSKKLESITISEGCSSQYRSQGITGKITDTRIDSCKQYRGIIETEDFSVIRYTTSELKKDPIGSGDLLFTSTDPEIYYEQDIESSLLYKHRSIISPSGLSRYSLGNKYLYNGRDTRDIFTGKLWNNTIPNLAYQSYYIRNDFAGDIQSIIDDNIYTIPHYGDGQKFISPIGNTDKVLVQSNDSISIYKLNINEIAKFNVVNKTVFVNEILNIHTQIHNDYLPVWNDGAGNIIEQNTPFITYDKTGLYSLKKYIYNKYEKNLVDSFSINIQVIDPRIDFFVNVKDYKIGDTLLANITQPGEIRNYNWNLSSDVVNIDFTHKDSIRYTFEKSGKYRLQVTSNENEKIRESSITFFVTTSDNVRVEYDIPTQIIRSYESTTQRYESSYTTYTYIDEISDIFPLGKTIVIQQDSFLNFRSGRNSAVYYDYENGKRKYSLFRYPKTLYGHSFCIDIKGSYCDKPGLPFNPDRSKPLAYGFREYDSDISYNLLLNRGSDKDNMYITNNKIHNSLSSSNYFTVGKGSELLRFAIDTLNSRLIKYEKNFDYVDSIYLISEIDTLPLPLIINDHALLTYQEGHRLWLQPINNYGELLRPTYFDIPNDYSLIKSQQINDTMICIRFNSQFGEYEYRTPWNIKEGEVQFKELDFVKIPNESQPLTSSNMSYRHDKDGILNIYKDTESIFSIIVDIQGKFIFAGDNLFCNSEGNLFVFPGLTQRLYERNILQSYIDTRDWVDPIPVSIDNTQNVFSVFYSSGILNLRSENNPAPLTITSITGRQVYNGLPAGNTLKINLAPGMYLVRLGNQTAKLVVN